jgi:hypothetical protein
MRIRLTLLTVTAAALLARGATAVTIADVLANADAYDGQSVVLTGVVDVALPVLRESGYNLRDGSAVITIISRTAAPAVGAHLAVTGRVFVFKEGDDAEANVFPPGLFEASRSPAP